VWGSFAVSRLAGLKLPYNIFCYFHADNLIINFIYLIWYNHALSVGDFKYQTEITRVMKCDVILLIFIEMQMQRIFTY
jgi:hypothetical protein